MECPGQVTGYLEQDMEAMELELELNHPNMVCKAAQAQFLEQVSWVVQEQYQVQGLEEYLEGLLEANHQNTVSQEG